MRRAALRSALTVKAAEENILILEDFNLPEIKTRVMSQVLRNLVGDQTALILAPEKDAAYETFMRVTSNLPEAKLLLANYLNIRDLFGYDKLILPLKALDVLTANLAS
jgi:large subunit ribosomal protein L4